MLSSCGGCDSQQLSDLHTFGLSQAARRPHRLVSSVEAVTADSRGAAAGAQPGLEPCPGPGSPVAPVLYRALALLGVGGWDC